MNIAILPARGGSKRIPRKNVKAFCGKPMLAYPIAAAIESGLFEHVLVSTDDDEIAAVAKEQGAIAPFQRPGELSDDHTPLLPVVRHAITWVENNFGKPNAVCCILPTAPMIRAVDIVAGFEKLTNASGVDFVLSATNYKFPIFRALKFQSDGTCSMIWPENDRVRSQDFPEAYHDAGQFYWATRATWLQKGGILSSRNQLVQLPRKLVQDIDTPEDWEEAELLFQLARKRA
ncbi:MAG: pseudaminic acid cytidylyltransferase [Verrucomicrobia bacterium]|jgi:N-acylneuraminate cytidylyltransferase|nr:pseudaminic acid cytidylyltransferase [Verrucomicrobiota bacterium]